jgi:4-amino-4-deoxy-L-arabinose transferase-like glycosyltransferase
MIKKYGSIILSVAVLIILYFILRIYHLTSLPLFTDESIYIRWSQIGLHDPAFRFLSLTDGKQPLFIWIMYPFLKIFHDPLVGGRLVSVFSGLFTMLGLGATSYLLFRNRLMAFLTMLLYICYPFAQVMDRMALYDSMVAMFFIWSLFAAIVFVRHIRLDVAYTLGFILGAGILTKTSNFLSIYFLPLTLILFDFKQKHWLRQLLKWAALALIAIAIAEVIYGVLHLSPLPNVISVKNNTFYYPLSVWIQHPFEYIGGNLHGLLIPLGQYFTLPYLLLIVISLIFWRKDFKAKIMLLGYFLLPFIGFSFIAKEIFARYVFFMSLPLLLLAGWGLSYTIDYLVKKANIRKTNMVGFSAAVVILFLIYPAYVSYVFAADPLHSAIADSDKSQYITAWTSGWGLNEAVSFFKDQAQNGPIYIATEGTFGLYPGGLELYLDGTKNISIKGYYFEILQNTPQVLIDQAAKMPTYMLFYQPCPNNLCPRPGDAPAGWPLTPVKEFTKAGTTTRVVIYKIHSVAKAPHETSK